jgi:hypothetical protein
MDPIIGSATDSEAASSPSVPLIPLSGSEVGVEVEGEVEGSGGFTTPDVMIDEDRKMPPLKRRGD